LTEIDSREKAVLLCRFALEKKAYDLVLMEVRALTSIADYFIVCSGRSDRQVQSIAQGIEENMRGMGVRPQSVEGVARGQWVLMDFSDVIVHVFYQPVREFYDLEGLWIDAPRVELPEPYASMVQEFRIKNEQHL
jgi:ribosome-associated protein